MEKTLNIDERIRRAEEVYYRRKSNNEFQKYDIATVNVGEKRNFKLLKKILIQVIICTIIYSCYYYLKNKNTAFFPEIKSAIQNVLNYDINVSSYTEKIQKIFYKRNVQEVVESTEKVQSNNKIEETLSVSEEVQDNENMNTTTEEVSSISQMEEDANILKSNNSFIIPLEGTITSRFGIRNPTTETVPKYHTGIDIGAGEGTVIISSIEGTVIQTSNQGDYRKSFKDRKWRSNYSLCTL